MVAQSTLLRDVLFFIKDDLDSNITDPISASRSGSSNFVMTSFPQRSIKYPLITIKAVNIEGARAGMNTLQMDYLLTLEVRIWARNEKEKDDIWTQVIDRLNSIQFTATTGSIANGLHEFNISSSVEVDEEGAGGVKSRVLECTYLFIT